jgi:putative oxidoreductase
VVIVDLLIFIGRVLFVILFLTSAVANLTRTEMMAAYAESKGVPAARNVTLASGVVLLVGALSVLLGIWADIGALLLFVFLVPTAFLTHAFWKERDNQTRQVEIINFQKDLALAGAALMLFGLFGYAGTDLGLMITSPLLDIG